MNKFFKIAVFIMIFCIFICGCNINDKSAKYQRLSPGELKEGTDIKQLVEKIYNDNSDRSDEEAAIADDEIAEKLFYLNLDDVDEYYIQYAPNDQYADNVAVVRAKEGKAEAVAASLEKRLNDIYEKFKDDSSNEIEKVDKGKIILKGNYVMLIAVKYADGAQNTIISFFSNK